MARASLSVVVVTHEHAAVLPRTLPGVAAALAEDDELIVVDNASSDGTAEVAGRLAPRARVLRSGANLGFAGGANAGAEAARGDLLVLLNPDASVAAGFADAVRRPLAEDRGWAAWMGLVTMEGGSLVNTSGGITHFTGVSWAGDVGRPVGEVPREPREVGFLSGACLAVPLETWRACGGMPESFFLYLEDVDLSLRLRLAGGRLVADPAIRADHEYEFHKGALKWRMLERNRAATLVRCWPAPLLVLVAPALVLTEAAIALAALRGGWWREKLSAWRDLARALPRLVRERREIQAGRSISALEFARHLTAELSSPYLGGPARSRLAGAGLRAYWRAVLAVLRVLDRRV